MSEAKFVPLSEYRALSEEEMSRRAADMLAEMRRRRSVRHFSGRPVPRQVIEDCLATAGTAPSGANLQPWHFVVVENAEVKRRIRHAAEQQEQAFYQRLAPQQWLDDLASLGTDANKPFLESAPALIVVFVEHWGRTREGTVRKHYYPVQSTGIAVGFLIAAIHHAGLVCLPYTPTRPRFLNEILGRGEHQRALMILPVGYPAEDAMVPQLAKKPLREIVTFL